MRLDIRLNLYIIYTLILFDHINYSMWYLKMYFFRKLFVYKPDQWWLMKWKTSFSRLNKNNNKKYSIIMYSSQKETSKVFIRIKQRIKLRLSINFYAFKKLFNCLIWMNYAHLILITTKYVGKYPWVRWSLFKNKKISKK